MTSNAESGRMSAPYQGDTESTQSADTDARLTAAYHTLFDVKDTLRPGSEEFCDAANAIRAIGRLLADLGCYVPIRYDAPRTEVNP